MRNPQELQIDVFGRPISIVAYAPNRHCVYCRNPDGSLRHKYKLRTPMPRFEEITNE